MRGFAREPEKIERKPETPKQSRGKADISLGVDCMRRFTNTGPTDPKQRQNPDSKDNSNHPVGSVVIIAGCDVRHPRVHRQDGHKEGHAAIVCHRAICKTRKKHQRGTNTVVMQSMGLSIAAADYKYTKKWSNIPLARGRNQRTSDTNNE